MVLDLGCYAIGRGTRVAGGEGAKLGLYGGVNGGDCNVWSGHGTAVF